MMKRAKRAGFWSPEGTEPRIKENWGQKNSRMEKRTYRKTSQGSNTTTERQDI